MKFYTELGKIQHGIIIKDGQNEETSDAVNCIILSVTRFFIRDSSTIKEKNMELLTKLRCKTLQDFKWYTDTFLTRVMCRSQRLTIVIQFEKKNFQLDYLDYQMIKLETN